MRLLAIILGLASVILLSACPSKFPNSQNQVKSVRQVHGVNYDVSAGKSAVSRKEVSPASKPAPPF